MPIDIEPYLHHLDGYHMDDQQKAEIIHSVSDIMKSFVDQAWGLDPVQLSLAARSKDDSARLGEQVQSKEQGLIEHFEPAADNGAEKTN